MISRVLRSMLNRDRLRWPLIVIGAVCCLTFFCQIEVRGESTRFFATKSLSRASRVPGASGRVTQGPTPSSTAGKRWFTKRVMPVNQRPGLRKFKGKMFEMKKFREFGYKQAGAQVAPGAARKP